MASSAKSSMESSIHRVSSHKFGALGPTQKAGVFIIVCSRCVKLCGVVFIFFILDSGVAINYLYGECDDLWCVSLLHFG